MVSPNSSRETHNSLHNKYFRIANLSSIISISPRKIVIPYRNINHKQQGDMKGRCKGSDLFCPYQGSVILYLQII